MKKEKEIISKATKEKIVEMLRENPTDRPRTGEQLREYYAIKICELFKKTCQEIIDKVVEILETYKIKDEQVIVETPENKFTRQKINWVLDKAIERIKFLTKKSRQDL